MREVVVGGNLDVVDELLAPNYVSLAMGGADLAGMKAMVSAMSAAIKQQRIDDEELVAEGTPCSLGSTTLSPSPRRARRRPGLSRTTASPMAGSL
jgi:hypothetical protein